MRIATQIFLKINQITQSPSLSPPPSDDDDNIINQILKQLNEWLALLPNLIHSLVTKFNDAFPPEQRPNWTALVAIAALAVVVLWVFCCCCLPAITSCIVGLVLGCWNLIRGLFRCLCCCGCCGRRSYRMMKAPGRGGAVIMPRSVFESNPRGYFADLRSGRPLLV